MDISLVKNTLTARARSIQKTGIFAGYSFPCKDKDKLDRLYIFQNRIDSNFETVRWEKQSVWVFPKIWPIFNIHLHSSTARDHCALLHRFQPKMKVVCSPSVQFYKQFPKTCVHFLMYFLHPHLTHVVCNVRNFHAKNMCVMLWNG